MYHELRQLAARRLAREKPGQTLQATELVHEAYLRLVGSQPDQHWNSHGHFFGAAAEAMRRILIDHARRKKTGRAGGRLQQVSLNDVDAEVDVTSVDILALNDALEKLQAEKPRKAELVKLRFFAGLTIEETADVLGVSSTTVEGDWRFARAWLRDQLTREDAS